MALVSELLDSTVQIFTLFESSVRHLRRGHPTLIELTSLTKTSPEQVKLHLVKLRRIWSTSQLIWISQDDSLVSSINGLSLSTVVIATLPSDWTIAVNLPLVSFSLG